MDRRAIRTACVLLLTPLGSCDRGGGATAGAGAAAASPVVEKLEAHFAGAQPPKRRFVMARIQCAPGDYKLPAEAAPVVAEVGRVLAAHPDAIVRLESFAKESGTDADEHLAAKRAHYVGKALEKAGVRKRHIFAVSWSAIASADAAALGPLENGRTDLVIYTKAGFETPT